jgi:hypothetical protein
VLLHWACVLSGLRVALAGALWFSTGSPAHAVAGGLFFALGSAGIGLQGWHAVKRLWGRCEGGVPDAEVLPGSGGRKER